MHKLLCLLLVVAAMSMTACSSSNKATSLVLPDEISTPDGMTVAQDGNIYVSMLNLEVPAGAAIWTIDKHDQLAKLIDLPKHPQTGEVYPLGITQGADGNFYVADNQTFGNHTDHKSRLLRIVMVEGKAARVETVATGFIAANAVEAYKNRIYVTETCLINDQTPHVSGLYKFELSELSAAKPVQLKPDGQDPRLVAKFTTTAPDWRKTVGANGLAISPKGMLYVCNFGEASVLAGALDPHGMLAHPLQVLVKGEGMGSTDGMKYLKATNKLVIADFFSNAVHVVDAKTGEVKTLASNGNSDGSRGQFDKPSEPCVRGNKLYVSNIDLPRDGNTTDRPHSIVVMPIHVK